MTNWLTLWGETSRPGFAFTSILVELAKDGARDYILDFFKDRAAEAFAYEQAVQVATGQALTEFLYLVQQELEDADLNEAELEEYALPLRELIRDKSVAALLGSAFEADCSVLDGALLAKTWERLGLLSLPEELSWQRVAKRYLKKVKAVVRESADLREILDSPAPDLRDAAATGWREYRQWLQKQYGNLRLDSLDTSGAAYNQLKLWRIFIPQSVREVQEFLPQVHEMPKEVQKQLAASGQLEEELSARKLEEYRDFYYRQQTRSVLEALAAEADPYLVILGDPGSGKTTLLQYRALQWAESPLKNLDSEAVPILIELRLYMREDNRNLDFLEFFIQQAGKDCHLELRQIQELLASGRALLLFDGLDEVFNPEQRQEIVGEIIRFTKTYPQVRTIVTSRVIGYNQKRLREAGFRHLMLQDLESAQVTDFIQRWHELTFDDPIDKEKKRERLERAIEDSAAIRELAGNPLLLTMMAILNRNQELPRDRAELYNQASRLLLHQWDTERALRDARLASVTIDYKDKQEMLRKVAYFMQANSRGLAGNSIARADLERIITEYLQTILSQSSSQNPQQIARVVLDHLRTRNFILCFLGGDYYAFVHRTFLEFFCAWEFVWQFEKEQKLESKQLIHETFGQHWQDESWHEVLRLIAGMLEPKFVGEAIEYLIKQEDERGKYRNLLLAAKCLSEVRNRSAIAARTIKLLKTLKELIEQQRLEPQTFAEVMMAISTWKDDPDTLPWVKSCANSDNNKELQIAALQVLAKDWQKDPEILSFLKDFAENDKEWRVRQTAAQGIAKGWQHDPDALAVLKKCAKKDKDWSVRVAVMKALVSGWKDNPDALAILKERAREDGDTDVLRATAEALVKWWKDDPDILAILKERAREDESSLVRKAVIETLASGWKDEPEAFELLCSCALNDPFKRQSDWQTNPRQTALEAIVKHYLHYPQTLYILRDRAEKDPDPNVRITTVKELVKWFKDEPGTFEFLRSCALNDPFKRQNIFFEIGKNETNPRQTILKAIVEQYRHRPQTLDLLRDRAENDPDERVRRFARERLRQIR